MKVWNFEKIDKSGNPYCCKIQHIATNTEMGQLTCISANEAAGVIVCGFTSGTVEIIYNDITRVKKSRIQTICNETSPITGLAIKYRNGTIVVFVTTSNCVFSIYWNFKEQKSFKNVIDDSFGCGLGCSTLGNYLVKNQFFVAFKNMISYCYDDIKAESIPTFGNTIQIFYVRGFIIALWDEKSPQIVTEARLVDYKRLSKVQNITIYDIRNELIAYSNLLPPVLGIVEEFGFICLILNNGEVFCLIFNF
ncbi:vacuolar protein sorting-associated protein 11 homolog [Octopus sinensis]|uniref:Vacuolar protein sorting-associated protein 11 homolog n=1 Tax=Octopus sinensis TaxID=2607531 RepID=A0A6P7U3C3_9MOLL|nr:vacuolar protein sorting-associated protein 11 homolog [Octopus sinensis]